MNQKAHTYWLKQAKLLSWEKKPKKALAIKPKNYFEWYPDGKLNVAFNCLNTVSNKNKTAIYLVDKKGFIKSYSYREIENKVFTMSNLLRKTLGKKKKNIMIFSPTSIHAAVCMLSSAQLGLHHCVIFDTLAEKAILKRIKIFKPDLFICNTDEENFNCNVLPALEKYYKKIPILTFQKFANKNPLYINLNKDNSSRYYRLYKPYFSNTKLFSLFTSGTTGEPKGITHSSAGYLLYTKLSCLKQFGVNTRTVFLTASDAGWMNGHTYALYGPLSCGASTVLVENTNLLLNEDLLMTILNETKTSILYLPVTLIRMIRFRAQHKVIKSNNLKVLGSMGEPLSPSVAKWYSKYFNLKEKSVINAYYQTETGAIICSPKFSDEKKTVSHGSVGKQMTKHLDLKLINNKPDSKRGEIIIKNLWPGCMISLLNKDGWQEYWKNNSFRMFDIGSYDKKGQLVVHGRNDDVINIRGHRIGSEEVESILMNIDYIKEVAAIELKDELEGSRIAVVISKKSACLDLKKEIKDKLIKNFGEFAIPKSIFIVDELPKTRSGKILRRLLRILLNNENINVFDKSILINSKVLDKLKKQLKKSM